MTANRLVCCHWRRPEGTAFSFNGGKDSTVLLHLIRAAVAEQRPGDAARSPGGAASRATGSNDAAINGAGPTDERPAQGNAAERDADQRQLPVDGPQHKTTQHSGLGGIRTFVFKRGDDFREIRDFVSAMDQKYHLNLEARPCLQHAGIENSSQWCSVVLLHHLTAKARTTDTELEVLQIFNAQVLSGDFKAGLTQLVNGGGVRAIFLGTRR